MTDISLEDLTEKTNSIYEAVVILSRRARQITDEQKLQIEMETNVVPVQENRDSEDFDEVEIDREALMREHKKYPKPVKVAIQEMLEGKIESRYNESAEEENDI